MHYCLDIRSYSGTFAIISSIFKNEHIHESNMFTLFSFGQDLFVSNFIPEKKKIVFFSEKLFFFRWKVEKFESRNFFEFFERAMFQVSQLNYRPA